MLLRMCTAVFEVAVTTTLSLARAENGVGFVSKELLDDRVRWRKVAGRVWPDGCRPRCWRWWWERGWGGLSRRRGRAFSQGWCGGAFERIHSDIFPCTWSVLWQWRLRQCHPRLRCCVAVTQWRCWWWRWCCLFGTWRSRLWIPSGQWPGRRCPPADDAHSKKLKQIPADITGARLAADKFRWAQQERRPFVGNCCACTSTMGPR